MYVGFPMTDLQSLHRALSEAESGSRELDAMIAHVIGGYDREVIEAFVGGFEVTSGASPPDRDWETYVHTVRASKG